MRLRTLCVVAGLGSAFVVNYAVAATVAFTGPVDRSGDVQGPFQIGDDFTVTDPNGIVVTQLGFFDDGFNGLSKAHTVALYDKTSPALPAASVTVPAGTVFDASDGPFIYANAANSNSSNKQTQGGYRYMNLATPLILPSGFSGSIVGYNLSDTGGNVDDYGESANLSSGDAGEITFQGSRFTQTSSNSGYPTANVISEDFGTASFTFVSAPEPASLSLVAIGALGLLARRRRAV